MMPREKRNVEIVLKLGWITSGGVSSILALS